MTDAKFRTYEDIVYGLCSKCKEYKPYNKENFYTKKGKIYLSNCKTCQKKISRDYTKNNRKKKTEYMRLFRKRKKEEKLRQEALLNK